MNFDMFFSKPDEKPLDSIIDGGGFCSLFSTIGVIGDSLTAGTFESKSEGITTSQNLPDFSWPAYIEKITGSKVLTFARGGMTVREFIDTYHEKCGVFNYDKLCQCYIIALGVNDLTRGYKIGSADSVDITRARTADESSIIDFYNQLLKTLKGRQPDAKIFLMTLPSSPGKTPERIKLEDELSEEIRRLAAKVSNTYVLDFRKYAPPYDEKFYSVFSTGHLTAAGYLITAKMVVSYIDYIIRSNQEDFSQVAFIGTPYKYRKD